MEAIPMRSLKSDEVRGKAEEERMGGEGMANSFEGGMMAEA